MYRNIKIGSRLDLCGLKGQGSLAQPSGLGLGCHPLFFALKGQNKKAACILPFQGVD